jgi:hypothetical protein
MKDAQDHYAEHLEKLHLAIPAGLMGRMTDDNWHFAIVLTSNIALYVEHVSTIRMGADKKLWIDAHLYSQTDADSHFWKFPPTIKLIGAPTSRGEVSINVDQIMFMVEMADT